MTELEALRIVADEARKLVEAVTHDDSGSMVAGQWVGGNGGLLSRETLMQNDRTRLALDALTVTFHPDHKEGPGDKC